MFGMTTAAPGRDRASFVELIWLRPTAALCTRLDFFLLPLRHSAPTSVAPSPVLGRSRRLRNTITHANYRVRQSSRASLSRASLAR